MYLYSLHVKSLDYYNPVFSSKSDLEALYFVRQSINTGSDLNLVSDIYDFELVRLADVTDKGFVTGYDDLVTVCEDLSTIPGVVVPSVADIRDLSSLQNSYEELQRTYNDLNDSYRLLEKELSVYKTFYSNRFSIVKFIKSLFKRSN